MAAGLFKSKGKRWPLPGAPEGLAIPMENELKKGMGSIELEGVRFHLLRLCTLLFASA